MRLVAIVLFGLAALAAGLGLLVALWARDMACGMAPGAMSGAGHCAWRALWDMSREDLLYTVLLPFGTAALLAFGGISAWRRADRVMRFRRFDHIGRK